MNTIWGMQLFQTTMLRALCVALAAAGFGSTAWSADLDARFNFEIAPQKLTTALVEFSRQANAQVVSDTKDVAALNSPGVSGEMSLQDGLRALLAGTSLG